MRFLREGAGMPQDAFHIRRLTKELNALLVGGKINRISQVNKDELTFIIYTGKSTVKLILSTNATSARVCLSAFEKEPAPVAPNFCMLLRKHLQNAEILSIQQYEFERIIEITLHCTTDFSECDRVLHCEIMGKYSNIVLTEKGVILGVLKTSALVDDSHRVLLSGAKYEYPAPQDKISPFDGAGMRRIMEIYEEMHPEGYEDETLAAYLFERVSGIALSTAKEIVKRAKRVRIPLWAYVSSFCESEENAPCLKVEKGIPTDFFAFPVDGGIQMPSLCKAEDEFYSFKENKKLFEDKKRKLESSARSLKKKTEKHLQDLLERLKETEKAEEYQLKGQLLTANLYRLERGLSTVSLPNWNDPDGKDLKITLDPFLYPAQNAQRYFKLYNKQKRAREYLLPMQKTESEELSYCQSILTMIQNAETTDDLKEIETELTQLGLLKEPKARAGAKRKETEIPFREYSHGGMRILLGRNNLQNDRLLRYASQEDIWLHTQKYHSSHAIIVTEGRQVSDETLIFASELCAYYSDGRNGEKIPVDYCKRKFVKKPNKSKAGFVVYTDYKTVLVTPCKHE